LVTFDLGLYLESCFRIFDKNIAYNLKMGCVKLLYKKVRFGYAVATCALLAQ